VGVEIVARRVGVAAVGGGDGSWLSSTSFPTNLYEGCVVQRDECELMSGCVVVVEAAAAAAAVVVVAVVVVVCVCVCVCVCV
jgi:hypothetical protein